MLKSLRTSLLWLIITLAAGLKSVMSTSLISDESLFQSFNFLF